MEDDKGWYIYNPCAGRELAGWWFLKSEAEAFARKLELGYYFGCGLRVVR